ncbi:MAG: hypothetical protein KAX65_06245, partial [Caldilineaceae bacterium]|nr:hypothetical protein [Caldilineaceae bacterium]
MSKLLTRTKSNVAAKKLAQSLGGKFEPAQTSVAGTVVGANLVSVGGQQYRSVGVDGDAGASVALRNIGTPAVAVYGPATGGAALASVGSNGGNTSSGGDHNPVALATPSGLQFADTLTQIGLALALPSSSGASSINAVGAGHSHAIDDTIARSAITLTAGDGLSGLGNLTANRTVAIELSATSGLELTGTSPDKTLQLADSVAGDGLAIASKVLAVGVSGLGLSVGANAVTLTSSSNPGAASSILASDATGKLTLPLLVASTSLTTPLILAGAGQSLTLQPPVDLILDPASNRTKMAAGVSIEASSYASQTTGWRVTDAGEADFRYLYVDEMHAKSFIADLEQALAGGQIIAKSVAVLYSNFTAPAAGATAQLVVRDLPSATGMAVFVNGDYIRIRTFSRSGGSLTIGDCWGTVALDTSYGTSGFDSTTKTQRYTFTRSSGADAGAMTAGTVVYADAIILDYGTAGNGIYEVNAIDGLYGLNSPYAQVATWATHPRSMSVKSRYGNLRGIFSVDNEYGLYAGSGTAVTDRYIRASNTALELRNVPLALYDGSANTMLLSAGASNNSPFLALGATLPTGPLVNDGIWLGKDGTAYKWRVGTVSGGALVKGIYWDGADLIWKATNTSLDASGNLTATNATLTGQVTANTGAVGGWTIGASGLTATNIGLYSGAANTARVQVGSGSDIAGINATAAGTDIAFWAGISHASRASAPFRVTAGGSFYATTGTIAGDFSVTGSGKLSASGGGIVMTATGINIGLYPNIDGGATPTGESKALAWYDTPSTATGLQARQYVGKANDNTPHWNVTVGPSVASPLTMSLWYGGSTLNGLWFTNLAQVSGLPALFLAKGTPETAQIRDGAQLQLNAGSTFLAYAHLQTGTAGTYDIGTVGTPWRKIYVGEVVATTISGSTALAGNTWQRADAGDMYIKSYTDATSRT